jgi:hypothetical protein
VVLLGLRQYLALPLTGELAGACGQPLAGQLISLFRVAVLRPASTRS